jgi:hypothetical protein
MNFDEWWATLSPPERRVIGEFNARFVWKEAVEMCAKVCDVTIVGDEYATALVNSYADAIRAKGQ